MSFPITDWQFWVASLLVLAGVVTFTRALLPRRKKATRTELTISAKRGHDSTRE